MRTRSTTLWFLGIAVAACGPEAGEQPKGDEAARYASAVCDAITTCECYDHFGSVSLCEGQLAKRFSDLVAAGFELDLDCFDGVLGEGTLGGCVSDDSTPAAWRCTVLRGAKRLGDPCSDHYLEVPPFFVNECIDGLLCVDGLCVAEGTIGPVLAPGDACFAEQAASCHAVDVYCGADSECLAAPQEGEPCSSPFACSLSSSAGGGSLYCRGVLDEGSGTCTRQSLVGEACDPVDWFACSRGGSSGAGGAWCDASEGLCVEEGPAICQATDYPNSRPIAP
jgi:hypothetical protein